jgi:peroxin-7
MAAMLEFRTQGYNPYAVKYSPYYDSRIAVASSANFGIVGNGRVFALGLTAQGVQVEKTYGDIPGRPPSLPSLHVLIIRGS